MKQGLYLMWDSASQQYNNPMTFLTDEVAIRSLASLLAQGNNEIAQHPEHFTLFKTGEYDQSTGIIELFDSQVVIAKAHELAAAIPKMSRNSEIAPGSEEHQEELKL